MVSIFKYNYIFCGSGGFFEVAYADIMKLDNVKYFFSIYQGIDSKFEKYIIRSTFSDIINKFIRYPFKSFSYKKIFAASFDNNLPICIVFFSNHLRVFQSSYLNDLRSKYQNIKIVLYLQDVVSKTAGLDIDLAKMIFDLVISYDYGDSKRYSIAYYQTPYSQIDNIDFVKEKTDIYYCGEAKTRYKQVLKVYEKCREDGLRCDFYLYRLPKSEWVYKDDIKYNEALSYKENLNHALSSKCILEINQEGSDGFTPRLWESIMYDKHLLTNNIKIKYSKYNCDNIHYTCDNERIKSWIYNKVEYSQNLKKSLSPINFLQFIETNLNKL